MEATSEGRITAKGVEEGGTCGADLGGFFGVDLADHEGSGDEIAEALAFGGEEGERGSGEVAEELKQGHKDREGVGRAKEVSQGGLGEEEGPPVEANGSDLEDAFSGGLAFPARFKEKEVAPLEEEKQKQGQGLEEIEEEITTEAKKKDREELNDPQKEEEGKPKEKAVQKDCEKAAWEAS